MEFRMLILLLHFISFALQLWQRKLVHSSFLLLGLMFPIEHPQPCPARSLSTYKQMCEMLGRLLLPLLQPLLEGEVLFSCSVCAFNVFCRIAPHADSGRLAPHASQETNAL